MERIQLSNIADHKDIMEVFTKPRPADDWITVEDIVDLKLKLSTNETIKHTLDTAPSSYQHFLHATRYFIEEMDNAHIVAQLNKLSCVEQYLQVMVGKLALKLKVPAMSAFTNFHNDLVKKHIAFTILHGLMETGKVIGESKPVKKVDEVTNQVTWNYVTFVTFGNESKDSDRYYVHGITTEPKVLQKTTKVQAGGKQLKLSKTEKEFLKMTGSTPLRMIDIEPSELAEYAKTQEWYQNVEDGTVKNMHQLVADRIVEDQVEKFRRLQKLERFYLPVWLDYRTRVYYENTQLLFNPHGKGFETYLYELADARLINEKGLDALKYSAVVIVDGRMNHSSAIEAFDADPEKYLSALQEDKYTVNEKNIEVYDFGKVLYGVRLAQAIQDAFDGVPSHFLLAEDATNGGLQHGGIGFKSEKMMIPSNVGGSDHQEDSHQDLANALGISRDEAKPYNTELLHGQSIQVTANKLGKTVVEAKRMLADAYGNEFFNVEMIADWGTQVVDNFNTSLMWTTRDGFKAQSIAYTRTVPLTLYSVSLSNKEGYAQTTIHADMPLLVDARGNAIYGKVGEDKTSGGDVKLRGLYANITHSIDATGLRDVRRALHEDEFSQGGLWKHDNFLVHPNDMPIVRTAYRNALLEEFDGSLYENAIAQIVTNFKGINRPLPPTLVYGTATRDMVENSHYFLAA